MVKRLIKNLMFYKLVVVEGRLPEGTARAENPFLSRHREKISWCRARETLPRN